MFLYPNQFHNYLKPLSRLKHIVENGLTQLYVVVAQRKDCIMKLINPYKNNKFHYESDYLVYLFVEVPEVLAYKKN